MRDTIPIKGEMKNAEYVLLERTSPLAESIQVERLCRSQQLLAAAKDPYYMPVATDAERFATGLSTRATRVHNVYTRHN